ncbi:low-affinity inorganic phosphate transporter [Citrobacter freundii]|nr:low-affinity inorganic phosphate transporter [Citrobacter freundii]
MNASGYEITRTRDAINNVEVFFQQRPDLLKQATGVDQLIPSPTDAAPTTPTEFHCHPANTINALERAKGMLANLETYDKLSVEQRGQLRRIMLCISDTTDKVVKLPGVSADDQRLLKKLKSDMLSTIEYAPIWIIMAVALALGIGTMIGWRRVATTIGEKIGKKGMTYAQGMSAQMTAAVSIGLASYTGMPVSTTHVLSSSVAGTMVVDGGGLQRKNGDQHSYGLGLHPASSNSSFRRAVLALPEAYLSECTVKKRVRKLARFFLFLSLESVPDNQRNHAD